MLCVPAQGLRRGCWGNQGGGGLPSQLIRARRRPAGTPRFPAAFAPKQGDGLMRIERIWLALGRQAVFWAVAGAFLVAAAIDKPARAEPSEPPSLETIKSSLDAIES